MTKGTSLMTPFSALWTIYLCIGIVCFVAALILDARSKRNAAKCTARVEGTVMDVSPLNYERHHVPVCSFTVNGKEYEIAGPLFEDVEAHPDYKSNLTTRDELPDKLHVPSIDTQISDYETATDTERYMYSALRALYPIGSTVDIYYEPGNPENAYVQRPIRTGRQFVQLLRVMGGVCFLYCTGYAVFYLLGVR